MTSLIKQKTIRNETIFEGRALHAGVKSKIKLITNLNETYEPFGTLRRGEHITVLIKQTNKKIPGEFLGRLVLGVEDGEIKVFGATIY